MEDDITRFLISMKVQKDIIIIKKMTRFINTFEAK